MSNTDNLNKIVDIDIKDAFENIGADYAKLVSGVEEIKREAVKELLLDAIAVVFPVLFLAIVLYVHMVMRVDIMYEDLVKRANLIIMISMFIPLVRLFSKVIQFRDKLELEIVQYTLLSYVHAGLGKIGEEGYYDEEQK